jgi:hypothetical protein
MTKAHEPSEQNRKTVEAMASHGITEIEIARVLGIAVMTLRKWYLDELETAAVKANSRVAQSLFDKAMGTGSGAVTACIFWLKCRARWVEPAPAEGYVGKKQQLEQAAKTASGPNTGWAADLETEVHPN